jgi:hypothetical protein
MAMSSYKILFDVTNVDIEIEIEHIFLFVHVEKYKQENLLSRVGLFLEIEHIWQESE